MRIWPDETWFGLTRRGRRILLRSLGWTTVFVLLCYGGLRSYILFESNRCSQLVETLSGVRIGDSERSLQAVTGRFPAKKDWDPGNPPGKTYLFRFSPWWQIHNLGHPFDWATLAFMRHFPRPVRRNIGLRDFTVLGIIYVQDGRARAVSADVTVEGRDWWLEAEWVLRRELPEYLAETQGQQKKQFHFQWVHLHMGDELGEGVRALVTPEAREVDIAAARNINMNCLSSLRGCAGLREIAPDAARRLGR
jgi:hypothetical protein